MQEKDKSCIYTFNNRGYIGFSVMKQCFEMSDEDVYREITEEHKILLKRLDMKGISYIDLKGALIPNQEKDKYETCLIIDSNQIQSSGYGRYVFEHLIPFLDGASTYSILHGDYIDIVNGGKEVQIQLKKAMEQGLHRYNDSKYQYSGQYYLIYFNRLTNTQRTRIVEGLEKYPWFTGYVDVTYNSSFKSYISCILSNLAVKYKKKIIAPHPSDYREEDNVNMLGYPFEENGFDYISIDELSFHPFLSYKIERISSDREDVGFSFNALFPKFDGLDKIRLGIKDEKWDKYLVDKVEGKGKILESLGYKEIEKERFIKTIYSKICSNYLYNLRKNEYGDYLFNVCIELETVNGNMRKTMVALKYLPNSGEMYVNTIT